MGWSRRSLLEAGALAPLLGLPLAAQAQTAGFTHGVASGDPAQDSVVLWTRYVGGADGSTELVAEMAEDETFKSLVSAGRADADPSNDHCLRIVASDLRPGRTYHYRFRAPNGALSPVGRTRTLPAGRVERVRIAVVGCANATSGWWNAYAHAAARDDLDLVVHTGDYIYESATTRSDALAELVTARDVLPRGEAVALADYRARYASYRRDAALADLHRRHPMIVMWDDHEVANNSWTGGARNHGPEDGDWRVRRDAGMRAYREWLPMRGQDYASYRLGDLATLARIETRLLARSRQLEFDAGPSGDLAGRVRAFVQGPLADPARTLMGPAQERWLHETWRQSVQDGVRWQLLASQVVMGSSRLPASAGKWFPPGLTLPARLQAELDAAIAMAEAGLPLSLDRWDGYPAARARLLGAARSTGAQLVVMSGDSHNAWAHDLRHDDRLVGVEFAGQSVSSLGLEKRFFGDPAAIARDFVAANPGLKWCDTSRRGYLVLDITRDRVEGEWIFLGSRQTRSTDVLGRTTMVCERGRRILDAS